MIFISPLRATALILWSTVLLNSACTHSQSAKALKEANSGDASTGETGQRWTDLGTLVTEDPVKLSMTENHIYALAGQTLYQRTLMQGDDWKEVETFDEELADIFTVSGQADTIILTLSNAFETLPLRISHDGGQSFNEFGSEFTDHPERVGVEYEVPKQFFREDSGKLYASLSGLSTAVSTDLGRTWTFALGQEGSQACTGGESRTITLPAHPGVIFKSQDCPMRDSTVASVRAAPAEQKLEKLIDESFLGQRSANTLAASAVLPDTLFIGVDDGIVRYNVREKKSDWLIEANDNQDWNGSFTQIWVNPRDPQHIVISGHPRQSRLEFLVFESTDGGKAFHSLRSPNDPEGLARSSGASTYGNQLVIAAKEAENLPRIWLVELSSGSAPRQK